ncbi:flagellar biosynthesis protein FlhB [Geothrix oryzae]|jgi:flagellar biosynthetic protein FlhB|uniref:Flagellar biosynthetic protein FlhB n=1 Tax=Geothrix oryzae TaxID=2927975 RepID=A0ABN6V5V1_9BACT|nr:MULTISPECIES: flagellar biosynthesis protein FlhB [Geothrix]BDU69515.1 flagellar biosynthesis protein FlhB [Geothrix oryzae]
MANDPGRTEKATPRRRQKARDEGSVSRSTDFDGAVLLWGNFFLFMGLGGTTMALMAQQVAHFLRRAQPGALAEAGRVSLLGDVVMILGRLLLPFLAVNLLVALATGFAQRGFSFSTKPLQPKFDRLNPAQGFKRIFSSRAAMDLIKSLAKFTLLTGVAYAVLAPRIPILLDTLKLPLGQSLDLFQSAVFALYRNVMLAMLLLALSDFAWQRFTWEKSIRMTKQEVKDEAKDSEGSPEVKQRQKSIMQATARRHMLAEVPKATVVVTNPTHVAIALRYDEQTAAPICVAKGLDHLALKIRERAREAGVPTLERPELARALYRAVEVDQPIPKDLYQAVAQVLAFVYRLRGAA